MFFIFDKYLLSAVIQPEMLQHIAGLMVANIRVWDG
jgi:hypothetical protein